MVSETEEQSGQNRPDGDGCAIAGQESRKPNLIDLWEGRRGKGRIAGFLQTAGLVMRRNGRLADHLNLPLDYSCAKRFRWAAIVPVLILTVVSLLPLLAVLGGSFIWPEMKDLVEMPSWAAVVLPVGAVVMILLQWGLWTGMVSWFFDSRKLRPEQRHRAVALAYYLSAPLVLLVVPVAMGSHNTVRELANSAGRVYSYADAIIPPWVITIAFICVMVYWLQMILFAARDILGRRAAGLVATGLGLPMLWLVSGVMVWLLPGGVMMWLFMYYSLAV